LAAAGLEFFELVHGSEDLSIKNGFVAQDFFEGMALG
jgi:hypothetical protein